MSTMSLVKKRYKKGLNIQQALGISTLLRGLHHHLENHQNYLPHQLLAQFEYLLFPNKDSRHLLRFFSSYFIYNPFAE